MQGSGFRLYLLQPVSLWKKIRQHPFITAGIIFALLILIAFAFAVSKFGLDWTGFNGGYSKVTTTATSTRTTTTATEKLPAKSLWDWLQLLVIPIMLAIGGFLLNRIQKSREEETTKKVHKMSKRLQPIINVNLDYKRISIKCPNYYFKEHLSS